ncbi:MAG: valine--tRNA ligase [Acidaminococcales bacterium]|jgi:valyl-tRNA synthetase|nr:valine--tRNA ligase [Acidaminococcales bacterium]
MIKNIPTVYDPQSVEGKWYGFWEENRLFHVEPSQAKKPFCIVIPPPNVTGQLHMGHAADGTFQDILIRWRRMQGYSALWLPGTDHAGIATQAKLEETLRKEENLSRYDLGREKFIERVWQWKQKYGGRIANQLRRLGSSCDWERERFTLDEGCSRAVREVFVRLYEKGLVYRGLRMTNWCVNCHTALSDIEVEHEEQDGFLWQVRYPLADGEDSFVTVATTRPETIPGDTAVAVHPGDGRYGRFVGRKLRVPACGRIVPVIADEYVDPAFGTGAVKVTPAHDPNDFAIGERHALAQIVVIDKEGFMTAAAGEFVGMDRYACREAIVRKIEAEGLLAGVEKHAHAVGHCQRCGTVTEPLVSLQWFVKMAPLAAEPLAAVKDGRTRFVPGRFAKIYENWLENIRDWCISRQIWWGHRIPAWYCEKCGQTVVSAWDVAACPECGGHTRQDEDVLDTWFSSALWPFSTLGWPDRTEDLSFFYPTSVLVTAYDIIFFWVARMMVMGLEFQQAPPFRHVFIHGLVRDGQGRKMSKSLGNGIDPLEVIEKYGADSLRFTLVTGSAPGNDMRFYWEKAEASRNFANKIWNAARFVLMNLEDYKAGQGIPSPCRLADRWILSRFARAAKETTALLEKYEIGEAARLVYEFIWDEFCGWYIELSKPALYDKEAAGERQRAQDTLREVWEGALKLLHPFMPFITEEIWQALPRKEEGVSIMTAAWPQGGGAGLVDEGAESDMRLIMDSVRAIRNMRAQMDVAPGKKISVILQSPDSGLRRVLREQAGYIETLAMAEQVEISPGDAPKPENAVTSVISGAEIYLPLRGLIDVEKEAGRLGKEKEALEKELSRLVDKLANREFLAKAPAAVVAKEEEKRRECGERLAALKERMAYLAGLA